MRGEFNLQFKINKIYIPGFLKTELAKNQFFLHISYDQSQASNGFVHLSGKNCIVSCFLVRTLAKSEKVLKSSAGFIDIRINQEIYREPRKREKKNTHTHTHKENRFKRRLTSQGKKLPRRSCMCEMTMKPVLYVIFNGQF